ncbi:hypothetical protein ILYODFUR_030623 [Ilyodon furcidens]|uniref:Uncharacterized protein n=1 Tax=Ilyodon furcidens TaxID=33524 RepID=A0ABV0UWJ8_9TELE
MHQPGTWAMQANHSRPSTTRQPPRCSHKTCSTAPPTRPPTAARCPTMGQNHRRKQWKKATTAPVTGDLANSTPKPRGHPSLPATRTLHGAPQPTKQSIRPAPPPKRGHIPINAGYQLPL